MGFLCDGVDNPTNKNGQEIWKTRSTYLYIYIYIYNTTVKWRADV